MNERPSVNPGRYCAVRCLVEMERHGYSNLLFKQYCEKLNERDTKFASAVFYGTLERIITLDSIIGQYIKKGVGSLDPEVRAVLRSGLYQIKYMSGIPERAAVNEAVNLCKKLGKSSASGLVNAVLHKCAGNNDNIDNDSDLSVKYSLCSELCDLLTIQYPDSYNEIMEGFFNRNLTLIGTNTLKTNSDSLCTKMNEEGVMLEKADLPDTFFVIEGNYLNTKCFSEGLFCIQSRSSRQAVLSLDPKPGETMLDICAAPGGKSILAAMLMNNKGRIDSVDIHKHRVELIEKNAKKFGADIIDPVVCDALEYNSDILYDRVLCDVPCAGFGEISSKPELRYKAPGKDDDVLFKLQFDILEKGLSLLKPHGRLVYSTCSIDRRENDYLTKRFLELHDEMSLCSELSYTILPGKTNSEGFYIATFERL